MAIGKFQGVMSPTTPTGRRSVYSRCLATEGSYISPTGRHASPAAKRRIAAARSASRRDSRNGFPISPVMSWAIRSARSSRTLAARSKNAARWTPGSDDQAGKASRAASIAVLASSASEAAKTPTTRDGRQGSRFSYVSPLALPRHSPPT
jgi:hypothetical protein